MILYYEIEMGILDIFRKKNKDEERVSELIKAFNEALLNSQWTKAIKYGEELLPLFRVNGNRANKSACYASLGAAYGNLGNFKKSIRYCEKSLELARDMGYKKEVEARCYSSLGFASYSLGDSKKAVEFYEKSLEIFKDIGNKEGESECYIALAVVYDSSGDFKKALEYHKKVKNAN